MKKAICRCSYVTKIQALIRRRAERAASDQSLFFGSFICWVFQDNVTYENWYIQSEVWWAYVIVELPSVTNTFKRVIGVFLNLHRLWIYHYSRFTNQVRNALQGWYISCFFCFAESLLDAPCDFTRISTCGMKVECASGCSRDQPRVYNWWWTGNDTYLLQNSKGQLQYSQTFLSATMLYKRCANPLKIIHDTIKWMSLGKSQMPSVTVLVLIKLTKFAVALRSRCGSCKLIFWHYFIMFCEI